MSSFSGRRRYLDELHRRLDLAGRGDGDFVLLRGRRQVGKSRLVTEFLARSRVRSVYFQAAQRPVSDELAAFTEAIGRSTLTGAEQVRSGLRFETWDAAFTWIAGTATTADPVVVVLDELPYLTASDPAFESVLQRIWDHTLEGRPVLLIVVGSDLAVMDALGTYGRPLYGRIRLDRPVLPMDPGEVAEILGLDGADAIDAHLTVGGFPRVLLSWSAGEPRQSFLDRALSDPTSALVVIGERMLAAEFPGSDTTRIALESLGHGERTFGTIGQRSGLAGASLTRALTILRSKQVVAADDPLSTARGGRSTRYRVADAYLRYWLRFVGPALADVERGRPDLALERERAGWPSYRGRAAEPVVRSALERLLPLPGLDGVRDIGAFWTRNNDVEVDLVGVADRTRVSEVAAVGSVKWRDNPVFGATDLRELRRTGSLVPGSGPGTRLLAVSRSGFAPDLDDVVQIGPADLLRAWTPGDGRPTEEAWGG